MNKKLCINCQNMTYFKRYSSKCRGGMTIYLCKYYGNLIDGRTNTLCSEARENPKMCGLEGKYFIEKISKD